jgi:hypothetical protein
MLPLYEDPGFTFRFTDDRLIPRFHLEGIEAGRQVMVYRIDPGTGERLGVLAMATIGEGGWVDLAEPIIVRAGEEFCCGARTIFQVSRTPFAARCSYTSSSGQSQRRPLLGHEPQVMAHVVDGVQQVLP